MSECILIIGATSDMAQAFAKRVSLGGKSLMLAARDEKILQNIANDIRVRSGVEVTTHLFDILDIHNQIKYWIRQQIVLEKYGKEMHKDFHLSQMIYTL